MTKWLAYFLVLNLTFIFLVSCGRPEVEQRKSFLNNSNDTTGRAVERYRYFIDTPVCTDESVSGVYKGVEFVDLEYTRKLNLTGTDIAHNYSNLMCKYVGNHLKELYRKGTYSRVDLTRIRLTTEGMLDGDDYVVYRLYIPLIRVSKSMAMTGFDHCGGWGHAPNLVKRKKDLLNGKIVKHNKLYISPLYKTPEGLEEYWIQWQHTDLQ
jgi:hypothetical protein